MKKISILLTAVLVASACTNNVKAPGTVETELLNFADSSRALTCHIRIELPVAKSESTQKMRDVLYSSMLGNLEERAYFEDDVVFESLDLDDIYQFYDSVATADYRERAEYNEDAAGWEMNISLKKVEETDKYIVFHSMDYVYYGGAHGGFTGMGAFTFNKADGSLVDMLDASKEEELQPILIAGLESFFRSNESDIDMEDIMVYNDGYIELPDNSPYPSEEGLVFDYGEYEVAWYAAGAPCFTVPYETIEPFLTSEAKRIL